MANIRKRISELTALTSASLDTTIVGIDGGTTYKIELDTLADAVTSRVNILDRDRLSSLESVTSSFETKGRSVISSSAQITSFGFISSSITLPTGTISSSAQITSFGFVSSSIDISSLNSFTSSQSTLNTAFTNGINARLQTSSFNQYTASQSTSSLVDRLNTIESVSGSWITESETGSFLTSLSGAISSSAQITTFGFVSGSYETTGRGIISSSANLVTTSSFNSYTASISTASLVTSISNLNTFTASQSTASLVTSISNLNTTTSSLNISVNALNTATSSYETKGRSIVSGSSQLPTLATTGSNTFNGNQTISGSLSVTGSITSKGNATIGTGSGDEGGEITMAYAQTTSLSGSAVVFDVYQDKLRIFEGAGTNRGAYLNVASQSTSVGSSIVTSPNLLTMQTITSASYAALTPVSGTLYIIIG